MTAAHAPDGIERLILNRKGDRSYERLSADSGGRPSANGLWKMVNQELKAFPDPETIEGLSRGLNAPVREIIMACSRSLGLNVVDQDPDDLVIVGAKRLPESSQNLIISIAQTLMDPDAWPADVVESKQQRPESLPVAKQS